MTSEFDLPPAAYIRLDLMPAVLRGPMFDAGVADRRRIVVTDAHAYVFVDAVGGPVLEKSWELVSFSGNARVGYTVELEGEDEALLARRSTGCLCGSRLRGIRPFPGVPHQARTE